MLALIHWRLCMWHCHKYENIATFPILTLPIRLSDFFVHSTFNFLKYFPFHFLEMEFKFYENRNILYFIPCYICNI